MLNVRTQNITIVDNITGEDVTEQYALLMTQEEKDSKPQKQKEREKTIYKRLEHSEKVILL